MVKWFLSLFIVLFSVVATAQETSWRVKLYACEYPDRTKLIYVTQDSNRYFLEFASKGGSVFHEKEVSYDKSTSGAAKIFTGVLETVNLLIVLQWEPEVSGYYGFINYGSGNAERLICREVIDVY